MGDAQSLEESLTLGVSWERNSKERRGVPDEMGNQRLRPRVCVRLCRVYPTKTERSGIRRCNASAWQI